MLRVDPHTVQAGDALSTLVAGSITRHLLGVYAGASGDGNPLHIDSTYARQQAGMPGVLAHGTLSAAYLGRLITRRAGPLALQQLQLRFTAVTHLGDQVHSDGRVTDKRLGGSRWVIHIELEVRNQAGTTRLVGTSVIVS